MTWEERGATLRMHRLPRTRDALLDELSAWRRDVDAELAANPDRREALAGQQHLLGLLTEQCHAITPDVRAGICFEPDSEVARYVEHIRSTPPRSHAMETREGTEEIRVIPVQAGGVMFYPPLPMPVNRAPAVGGFSIAPAAPAPVSPPGPSAP